MAPERKVFVNVDELLPQVSLEQAALYYGVSLPPLRKIGAETRSACFLQCGKDRETGDRALAIQTDEPTKKWKCHQYGCTKGGNLVGLCDLLKPGPNAGGKPRGERFKEIAADLKAMVAGVLQPEGTPPPAPAKAPPADVRVNVPLAQAANERARALTDLDRKFLVEIAGMSPKASSYFRRRPYLTPEVCRQWRMGYLPRDVGGEDKSGGTLRGKVVYPYLSESGEVLCWFGRDPEFEERHAAWEASDKREREPEKFHFVKGFHRGLELWNQHGLRNEGVAEQLRGVGLLLVEGPNDVIRLACLGVPAVALCSNQITREQAVKAARLARTIAGGIVTLFLDCDPEGHSGMRQCLGYLAQLVPVRLAWTEKMYGGKFQGRQPESLTPPEWEEIRAYLVGGAVDGWSLG